MTELEKLFNKKLTENGDITNKSTGNKLLDLFFMTEYYQRHLAEVKIGDSDREKLFSMFIRDARLGLGKRDLGRELMKQSNVSPENVVFAGRFDDLLYNPTKANLDYLKKEVEANNELAKKWCPRLTTAKKYIAKALCKEWGISEKKYRSLIKCDTTENKLSRHREDEIIFDQVPSLAMIKYYQRFRREERFLEYLESVKSGDKKINISTATVYDIYRNRLKIDPDMYFDKIEKIEINCIPILDTSGSMYDGNDSIGKAMSIAHYLAKCSTYCNNHVLSFSNKPQLIELDGRTKEEGGETNSNCRSFFARAFFEQFGNASKYQREIASMYTGDCSNTDFGKVMELLSNLKEEFPEYFVVLSDMEFDEGSTMKKNKVMKMFKERGCKTKIIWWNFNSRHTTSPETDDYGNIFISGYNPHLLKYLQLGFDGEKFLNALLEEYENKIKALNK